MLGWVETDTALGYGGGFFDRTLAAIKKLRASSVCHKIRVSAEIIRSPTISRGLCRHRTRVHRREPRGSSFSTTRRASLPPAVYAGEIARGISEESKD